MEEHKNTGRQSNTDIINEITSNLKDSLEIDVDKVEQLTATSNEAPSTTNDDQCKYEPPDFDDVGDGEPARPEQPDNVESEHDYIDETLLKDAEVDLTDDEKEERRARAEQLKMEGNEAFKNQDFEASADKYTEGLRLCPLQFTQQRSVLYCNRSAAKMKLEQYKQAARDCTKAIELDDKYLKAYLRRAQSYEATDNLDESLADYKKILELDPAHREAQKALERLPPLIEEKNEKLKQEMMGKLKDLGNMLLRPFGLSTDNFKLEQDPESKGYKINFQQ